MENNRDRQLRLKALGNAERLRVLAYLRNVGEATVGDVAKALSIAPGSASYHIGCLFDGGLVQRVEHSGGDGRKSWWQAVDMESQVEGHEETLLFQAANEAYGEAYGRYLKAKDTIPAKWVDTEAGADAVLELTVDEAQRLKDDLESFVRRWIEDSKSDKKDRGVGLEPVALVVRAFRWIP